MRKLQPPDSMHLEAAQGWLGLGNHVEADAELDKVSAALRAHPDVLRVRWEVYAAAKKWDAALDIAAALVQLDPEDLPGFRTDFGGTPAARTARGQSWLR
jgi:hypothetical protein